MRRIFFSLLALAICLQICLSNASLCTDACDRDKTAGTQVTWCGSDGLTHTTSQGAITLDVVHLSSDCYSVCGISVKHVGQCGCPNGCYNETGNGYCDQTLNACICAPGWKGADCQSPRCTSSLDNNNPCSGHGTCKSQDPSNGDDYCICDNGYTGYDCSVKVPQHFSEVPYGTLPFGEIDVPYEYYKGEANGNANPMFNTSTIATVRVTISDADFNYQTNPANRRVMQYVTGNMWFDNGNVRSYQKKISFRLKGLSSRMLSKKSWNIKFDKAWNGLKGLSMKAGPDDRAAVFPFVAEMHRMMKAQSYRVTFANLFVNGFFYGVYSMHERMDKNFLTSRVGSNTGNLYQLGQVYYGQYLGSTPQPYQSLTASAFDNIPLNAIELEEGTEDWTDLTMLITVLNATQLSTPYLSKYYDVNEFLRYSTVDLATDNFDSYYGTGNNYMLMNNGSWSNPYWTHYVTDFDNSFKSPYGIAGYLGMTADQLRDLIASGVTSFYGFDLLAYALSPNPYMINNRTGRPFANAVYQLPGVNDTFTAYMTDLVQRLIFTNPGRMQARLGAFRDMVRPMLLRDKMYGLPGFSIPNGIGSFDSAFDTTTPAWYNQKYAYLGSMFIAKGHGTCDAMGVCVCQQYYSGPTCATYTPPPPTPPPTPKPTPPPTPKPTPSPCSATAVLVQRGNSWSDNTATYTQYDITFTNTGSRPITAAKFLISGNPLTQQWNLNTLGNNLYSPNIWNPMAAGASSTNSYGFTAKGTAPQLISVNSVTCS